MKRILALALLLLAMAVPAVAQEKDHTLPKGMELGYALDWAMHRWNLALMTDPTVNRKEKLSADVRIGKDETYVTGLGKILPDKYNFHEMEGDTGIIRVTLTPNIPKGTLVGMPTQTTPTVTASAAQSPVRLPAPAPTPAQPAPTAPAPIAQAAPAIPPAQPKRPDPSIAPQSYSMDEINYGDQRPARAANSAGGGSPQNFQSVPQVNPAPVQYANGYGYANPLGVPPTYGTGVPAAYRSICGDSPVIIGCSVSNGYGPSVEYERVGYGPNDFRPVVTRSATYTYPNYGYGSSGYYGSGYYNSGFYGMPLFNFQLEELQAQYRDRRRTAAIKFKGGAGCDSHCLSNVHVMVVIGGKRYYLGGAAQRNNWFEDPLMVPLDENNFADLIVVREQAGTMRAFERRMWLPSRAMSRDTQTLAIEPAMFDQAMELRIDQQHITVETEPGKYETRGGAAGLPVR